MNGIHSQARVGASQEGMRALRIATFLLLGVGLGVYAVGVHLSDPTNHQLGLAGGTHPAIWLSFGIMGLAVGISVTKFPSDVRLQILSTLVALSALHAMPLLIEGTVRFPFSYRAFGHVDYVVRYGSLNQDLLPYQSWPSYMILGSALILLADIDPVGLLGLYYVLHQWVVFFLAFAIARSFFEDVRISWIATWLFLLGNWVGQGYFLPASLGLILLFGIVLVLIKLTQAPTMGTRKGLTKWTFLAILLILALVPTHLLVSVVVLLSLAFLALIGALNLSRSRISWTMSMLAGTLTLGWTMYIIGDYVLLNLPAWFDRAFAIASIAETTATLAFHGSDERLLISYVKTAFLSLISVLAIAGWVRARHSPGRISPAYYVLLSVVLGAFMIVPVTDYGGEIVSRAFAFSLLPLAIIACAGRISRKQTTFLISVLAVSIPLYTISAWGNQAIDYVAPAELDAAYLVFDTAPSGSRVMSLTDRIWRFERIDELTWTEFQPDICETTQANDGGELIYLASSQRDIEAFEFRGGDASDLIRTANSCFSPVYSNGVVTVLVRSPSL